MHSFKKILTRRVSLFLKRPQILQQTDRFLMDSVITRSYNCNGRQTDNIAATVLFINPLLFSERSIAFCFFFIIQRLLCQRKYVYTNMFETSGKSTLNKYLQLSMPEILNNLEYVKLAPNDVKLINDNSPMKGFRFRNALTFQMKLNFSKQR